VSRRCPYRQTDQDIRALDACESKERSSRQVGQVYGSKRLFVHTGESRIDLAE
jgi:hypothetical protein